MAVKSDGLCIVAQGYNSFTKKIRDMHPPLFLFSVRKRFNVKLKNKL